MSPTSNSSANDVVVDIVFGVTATQISGLTIYQGHKLWTLRKRSRGLDNDSGVQLAPVDVLADNIDRLGARRAQGQSRFSSQYCCC